jgi:2-C-methyl-D-erythritol 4-phosphate cytidylyltransferase
VNIGSLENPKNKNKMEVFNFSNEECHFNWKIDLQLPGGNEYGFKVYTDHDLRVLHAVTKT